MRQALANKGYYVPGKQNHFTNLFHFTTFLGISTPDPEKDLEISKNSEEALFNGIQEILKKQEQQQQQAESEVFRKEKEDARPIVNGVYKDNSKSNRVDASTST